mmetsp:Transcript_23227/g.37248  ORF Transcript_23227/g.37248 Transcript_23227/m.37248 type:complete len:355 (+) Transcript_23227:401-1465(+)
MHERNVSGYNEPLFSRLELNIQTSTQPCIQTCLSEKKLEGVSLTYITPEKLYGHRGSMMGEADNEDSKVFQYLGASGSTLVSFSVDGRMRDGVVKQWTGAAQLQSSKEFKTYKGIVQIIPLARKTGFVARCGDGYIRRYDQTVGSLASAAQPRAKAKFYLSEKVPAASDAFVTNVSVKADGKWMLATTNAAIYLTNWVDDDVKAEDFVIAELGLDPTVQVSDFGDFEFRSAKFDSSVEDDVANPDMCEKRIGAFITPGEDAACKDTVMVQWSLRDVFRGDNLKIKSGDEDEEAPGPCDDAVPVLKVGVCKLYSDHGSSPLPTLAAPSAPVEEWMWHKDERAVATLGDAMKTMKV